MLVKRGGQVKKGKMVHRYDRGGEKKVEGRRRKRMGVEHEQSKNLASSD